MQTISRLFLLAFAGTLAATAKAAESPSHPCAVVETPSDRLACYDAAFGRPAPRAPAPAVAPKQPAAPSAPTAAVTEPAPAPSPPPASSERRERTGRVEEEFGFTDSELRARKGERDAVPESLEATLASVDRRASGAMVLKLDNGQTWLQTDSINRARFAAGERVTIRKAALGSFMLSNGHFAVRVRRLE